MKGGGHVVLTSCCDSSPLLDAQSRMAKRAAADGADSGIGLALVELNDQLVAVVEVGGGNPRVLVAGVACPMHEILEVAVGLGLGLRPPSRMNDAVSLRTAQSRQHQLEAEATETAKSRMGWCSTAQAARRGRWDGTALCPAAQAGRQCGQCV